MLNTSVEYLFSLVKSKISVEELEKILFDMGFEIDELKGDEMVIEITPDRPDLLSTYGMARAINNFLGKKPKHYFAKKSSFKVYVDKNVNRVRPFTVCAVVKNIAFTETRLKEIIDYQEKLHQSFARKRKKAAIGIYPLENISPPIHYRSETPEKIVFKPLDSEEEMNGLEILAKHPKGIEYKELLEDKDRYPIFVDSKKEILSMPPIINSANLGKVTEKTKNVFVECSGEDLDALKKTLNLIVTILADFGGEINSVEVTYSDKKLLTPEIEPREIKLDLAYVKEVLGLELNREEIQKLLERMGYLIENKKVFIPSYRTDVLHPIDVVDDIGRAYGAGNFKPEFPEIATVGSSSIRNNLKQKFRELMIGLGFQEVFTLALTSKEEQFESMRTEKEAIILENQIESSINMIRVSILPELLKVLKTNQHHEFPQKIFEISEIVLPDEKSEIKSKDHTYLSAAISKSITGYEEISSVIDAFLSNMKLKYKLKSKNDKRFIQGRCAEVTVEGKEIGVIGEVCPKILDNFKLENPVIAMEIDLEYLMK